ncbi:MAG: SemiSWEET family sugar transporter [Cytophaga sp.]|uniref:SemiSWEET family sugar transporter n=1 Tax=Cytophaga sp. TaxID=29535 RepID=UPI003F7FAF18
MDIAVIIGVLASICTTLSLLPQLIKMIRTTKAGDVSYLMLAVLFVGGILWVVYGVLRNDPVIIVSNCVSTVINIVSSYFSIRYRPRDRKLTELA